MKILFESYFPHTEKLQVSTSSRRKAMTHQSTAALLLDTLKDLWPKPPLMLWMESFSWREWKNQFESSLQINIITERILEIGCSDTWACHLLTICTEATFWEEEITT
jgi:hypothetical protein